MDDLARDAGVCADETSGKDRVADLRRDVESLEIQRWIEDVRAQACDHAATSAQEACENIWRGAESVREIEGQLTCFTEDLDALLLRLESGDGGSADEDDGAAEEGVMVLHSGNRAPVADAHVGCAE